MTTADGPERAQAWSRYWASGAPHSCTGSFEGDYQGAIGAYWREVFARLRPDARVLDIATGNGPLPRMLLSQRPDADLRCDAVDLAPVSPAWAERELRVRFHGRCGAERLPFEDQLFDLVVSQFGIEYSDLSRSMGQALRVARPGAWICLVMHHADSRPCRLAHEELAHQRWLTQDSDWFAAVQGMLEPMALAASPAGQHRLAKEPERYAAIRQRYERATAALHARRGSCECPDLLIDAHNAAVQAFQSANSGGLPAGQARCQAVATWLDDIRIRLEDMTRHALDAERRAALEIQIRQQASSRGTALDAKVNWRELRDGNELMGVALTIQALP